MTKEFSYKQCSFVLEKAQFSSLLLKKYFQDSKSSLHLLRAAIAQGNMPISHTNLFNLNKKQLKNDQKIKSSAQKVSGSIKTSWCSSSLYTRLLSLQMPVMQGKIRQFLNKTAIFLKKQPQFSSLLQKFIQKLLKKDLFSSFMLQLLFSGDLH